MTHQTHVRAAFVTLALIWLGVGSTSTNVPDSSRLVWVAATMLPAGSAIAVAWHLTRTSLRTYTGAAAAVAAARAAVWGLDQDSSWAPTMVWALVAATTLLMYVELTIATRLR